MENNYKYLFIDMDIYALIGVKDYFDDYDYIYIPVPLCPGKIENSKLYEFELAPKGETNEITFKSFIKKMEEENKIKKILYISCNIDNIVLMKEKYNISCCFINTHLNDVIELNVDHEVYIESIERIEKILVKKKKQDNK